MVYTAVCRQGGNAPRVLMSGRHDDVRALGSWFPGQAGVSSGWGAVHEFEGRANQSRPGACFLFNRFSGRMIHSL
jgi:hypothetical protein